MESNTKQEDDGPGVAAPDVSPSASQDISTSTEPTCNAPSADDTRSSISSDKSDSKPPRSAMRRTSSIPKIPQSPRRVRFDFMGEVVLPTSSPQPSEFISPRLPSPELASDPTSFESHLATAPEEDDEALPPRKVCSSDALRALSRAPMEDGTVWTVVNSGNEEVASDDASPPPTARTDETTSPRASPKALTPLADVSLSSPTTDSMRHAKSPEERGRGDSYIFDRPLHDDESSSDEYLAMAKPKGPPARSTASSRAAALLSPAKTSPKSPTGSVNKRQETPTKAGQINGASSKRTIKPHEDDGLFHFEPEGLGLTSRPRPVQTEENEAISEEEQSEDDDAETTGVSTSIYATSPAVSIMRPVNRDDDASTPSRPKFQPGSLGSYKGRPLMMPVITNPELLDELDADEPSNVVVGRVPEESPTEAVGAPRSFSERLMLEDMMASAKAKAK